MRITRNILRSILILFIVGWLYLSFSYPPVLKEDKIELWCSDCQDPLLKLIAHAIDKSKSEIYLEIYSLTDPAILKALNNAAGRGVDIVIFYDKKRHPKGLRLDPKIKQASAQTSGLAHRKILVIDEKETYIGSANFTPSSLRVDSNSIVGISHLGIARYFSKKAIEYTYIVNDQTLICFSLPEDRKKTLAHIIEMIQQAERTIDLALYTLSHPILIEALIQAHKKGIVVTVYLDPQSARGICKETITRLKNEKIPTYLGSSSKTLHHKWMVVDEKKMISGSCNWTKAAFSKNQEALLYIEPLNIQQKNKIKNTCKIFRATGKKIACFIYYLSSKSFRIELRAINFL